MLNKKRVYGFLTSVLGLLVYWGLTPQQQPGSYQGGEMMMMKSVFWWRKPEYPEEITGLWQVTDNTFHTYGLCPVRGLNLGRSGVICNVMRSYNAMICYYQWGQISPDQDFLDHLHKSRKNPEEILHPGMRVFRLSSEFRFFLIQIYGQQDRCKSVEISKCIMGGGDFFLLFCVRPLSCLTASSQSRSRANDNLEQKHQNEPLIWTTRI